MLLVAGLAAGLLFLLYLSQVLVDPAQAIQYHVVLFLQAINLGLDTRYSNRHAAFRRRIFTATGQQDQE
jgi:hypothetical protein